MSLNNGAEFIPTLEVNPALCLFVIGPALTGTRGSKDLLDSSLRYLQTTKLLSFQAKRKLISEIKKAERLDIGTGLSRAVRALKDIGAFQEWLQLVYSGDGRGASENGHSFGKELEEILQLQKQGALIACTQLDALPGTQAVSIDDKEGLSSWATEFDEEILNVDSDDVPTILHLSGLFSHAAAIRIKDSEDTSTEEQERVLQTILQERWVIFVGYSKELHNPFLRRFLDDYYSSVKESVHNYPPILLLRKEEPFSKDTGLFSQFLTLEVPCDASILHNNKANFTIAKDLSDKQDSTKFQAFLLFNEKQSFRKLGEIIYHQSQSGEIYVRRDALSVVYSSGKILYSNIITYGGNGLKQLWEIVFGEGSNSLGKGLAGFGLQNAAIVWVKGRPDALGNVTEVTTTYAGKSTASQLKTHQPCHFDAMEAVSESPVSNGAILPSNIPPPPKLIKIKPTTTEEESKTDSSSPCSSISEPKPVFTDDKGDERYLQAIVDLHERINDRLNNGVAIENNSLATSAAPARENVTTLQPPLYCIAKAPELLLDIIGQTQYVKRHELKITTVDQISVLSKHRESLIKRKLLRPTVPKVPTRLTKPVKPAVSNEEPLEGHKIQILDNQLNLPLANSHKPKPVVMTSSVPNYCLVNQIPVMLVNPALPMVPAVNVVSNSTAPDTPMLCYVSPSGVPVIPTDNRPITSKTSPVSRPLLSSLLHSSKRPARLSNGDTPRKMLCVGSEQAEREAVTKFCDTSDEEDCQSNNLTALSTFSSDGSVQLWIFLLDLLLSPNYRSIIHWTGNEFEFRIAQPAGLAQLWGTHRNKPQMTYEKMSRAMRYYYSRGIIESVKGRKQTFKFSLDLVKYVSSNKDKKTLDYLKTCCHV